jgi:integrase
MRERSYRKWFRQIARAANIPDDVWSMDSRAGGATEAEEAGAGLDHVQDTMTHSTQGTTLRYLQRRERNITAVAEARKKSREAE